MRIKKKYTNEYLLTEDNIWVRNLCKSESMPVDLNEDLSKADCSIFMQNEFRNLKRKLQAFETNTSVLNAVIVSDGHQFAERHKVLSGLDHNEVRIFATNGALANWLLVGKKCPVELQRIIDWYVVNNPYAECKKFLPTRHSYYPPCVASCRTNPEFLEQYRTGATLYYPVPDNLYAGLSQSPEFVVDDYRNSVCAAMSLAYRMGARKILLLCCDDSFEEERPASVQLENGLWSYPQQLVSQNIIDAMAYWLSKAGVEVANCSSGKKLRNATYILQEKIPDFFKEDDE